MAWRTDTRFTKGGGVAFIISIVGVENESQKEQLISRHLRDII